MKGLGQPIYRPLPITSPAASLLWTAAPAGEPAMALPPLRVLGAEAAEVSPPETMGQR